MSTEIRTKSGKTPERGRRALRLRLRATRGVGCACAARTATVRPLPGCALDAVPRGARVAVELRRAWGRVVGDVFGRCGVAVRSAVRGLAVGRAPVRPGSEGRMSGRAASVGDAVLEVGTRRAVRAPEAGLLLGTRTLPGVGVPLGAGVLLEAGACPGAIGALPPVAPIPRRRSLTPRGRSRCMGFPLVPPRPASLAWLLRGVSSLRRLSMRSPFELQCIQFTSSKVRAASCLPAAELRSFAPSRAAGERSGVSSVPLVGK